MGGRSLQQITQYDAFTVHMLLYSVRPMLKPLILLVKVFKVLRYSVILSCVVKLFMSSFVLMVDDNDTEVELVTNILQRHNRQRLGRVITCS